MFRRASRLRTVSWLFPRAADPRATQARVPHCLTERLEDRVLLFAANVNFQQSTDAAHPGYLIDGG